jgi:ABC-2 type transport system permease protein
VVEPVRVYLLLAGTWMRAVAQYPASLAMLVVTQIATTSLDLVAILLIFAHTPRLGGFSLPEVMFLYGTATLSLSVADMGKLVPALVALMLGLSRLDVPPGRLAVVPLMVAGGVWIFAALWVLAASWQFAVVDGKQASNSITYGGGYLTQYPLSIFGRDVLRGLTFGVPLAFVNWEPALYVLHRPDPLGLPVFFRFASPLVALVLSLLAALAWRTGLRRYRSTGS